MWQGKKKALTFSYDDGVVQDKRLLEILNRNGLKGTFNLNGGFIGDDMTWDYKGATASHLGEQDMGIYKGHEIAVHGYTHPHLETLEPEELKRQLEDDITRLEALFGTKMLGMAYPFGTYNQQVINAVAAAGLHYARTVRVTHGFALPEKPLELDATCHHSDPDVEKLAKAFIEAEPEEPMLFYIWGHSYEFDGDDSWQRMEALCEMLSGHEDVYYCTNAEALGLV